MSKAKFEAARELIQAKQYTEARAILKTIDHPTARAWEKKLDGFIEPNRPTSVTPSTNKSPVDHKLTIGIGVAALVIAVSIVSAILLRSKPNDIASVLPTVGATNETIPTQIPATALAYENTLDNPIPIGKPIKYDTGTLQILEVDYPVGLALYSSKSYAPLINTEQYIGLKFSFLCASICKYPPEANLSLVLSDGSIEDHVSVFSLQDPMLNSRNSKGGWIYFHLQSSSTISALHVTNDKTSLFASLPN